MTQLIKTTPKRWADLMSGFGISANITVYSALRKAYTENHRAYHTLEHIDACLRDLDVVQGDAERPHEIEMALWFHDAIYDPFSGTNEADSANWAQAFLQDCGIEKDVISRIYDLIMVTKEHANVSDNDAQLMLDIDLSILGAAPHIYDQFEKDIRYEYKRVPGFIFKKNRKQILQGFLAKDRIFNHPYFTDKLEAQARENLARAIAAL